MMRCFLTGIISLVLITGCTVSKKMPRSNGSFNPKNPSGETLEYNSGKTEAFAGRLNLLYEKKIRGAPNSPVYIGENYIGYQTTRHRFIFFNPENGKRICRIKKGKGYILNPVVTDSLIILVRKIPFGQVRVRNFFTNKTIHTRTVKHIRSGPILSNNSLVIGTASGVEQLSIPGLKTGWSYSCDMIIDLKPIAQNGIVYFGGGGGLIGALSAEDGSLIWKRELPSDIVSDLSLGTYLYIGMADGSLLAFDPQSGQTVWTSQFDFTIHGSVTESNGMVYFGTTDTRVYALSADGGSIKWMFETQGIVTAPPVVFGDAVLVGSYDRYLYSLNRNTGMLLDKELLEGPVNYAVAVKDDKIFVACRKNRLYCFEGN